MALNPPINSEGQPMRVEGEYFAILRKNMEIEVKIEGLSKLTAKGKLFVTTARLVFVNEKHEGSSFKSFDMPLMNLYDEKFEQPIFGANYLSLKVKPLFNLIPADAKVKIWFMSGGCQKFLDIFLQILPQIRKRRAQGADPGWIKDLTTGKLNSQFAYVDPSDPTYVFVTQPAFAQTQQNPQMNDYYSKFPDAQPGVDYAPPSEPSETFSQHNQGGHQQQYQQQQHYQQPQSTVPSYGQNFSGQGISLETGAPIQQEYSGSHYQQQPSGGYQQNVPSQGSQGYNQYAQPGQAYVPQTQNTQSYGQNQQQYQAPQTNYNQYNTQSNQYGTQPLTQNQNQQYQPPQQYQGQQQGTQQQQQQQQQQPRPQPNVGYYYGFWGPQLNQRQPGQY